MWKSDRDKRTQENPYRRKLCFNSTGTQHGASACKSKKTCQIFQRKHHTPICDKSGNIMLATKNLVLHPDFVLKVNKVTCRSLLDTCARSSYASATLLNRLKVKPIQKETQNIDMMMISSTRKVEVYDLEISDLSGKFTLNSKVYKVDRNTLLSPPNPKYKEIIEQHQHLRGMNDRDTKLDLPIHMILGARDHLRIKVQEITRVGSPGEPVANLHNSDELLCLQGIRQI